MAGMTKALVAAVLVSLSLGAKISGRSALTFDASAAAKNRPLTKAPTSASTPISDARGHYKAQASPTPSPTPSPTSAPTPASSPADCTGVRRVFDAGFGGCDVYSGNRNNHQFCHRDFDEGQGFYAAQVCSECLVCQALDSAGEKAAEESTVAQAEKVRIDAEQERALAKENRALAKEKAGCETQALAVCGTHVPCIDLREGTSHHHLMWLNDDGTAHVDGEASNYNDNREWTCTCSGSCSGLVGVWNCSGLYANVITITSDYADDFTAAITNDHVAVCSSAPTPPPTPAPTPTPGVSGVGDPHLTNMYGERFDLYRTGVNVLLRIPQKAAPERTLLLVEADTQLMGTACSDLYFQVVSISGNWTNQSDSLQVFAKSDGRPNSMKWTRFDAISLKVVHGQTREGTDYLNVFAKNVFRAGYPVGGLLGADDHTLAATRPPQCLRRVFLHGSNVVDGYTPETPHVASEGSESSVAAAYS